MNFGHGCNTCDNCYEISMNPYVCCATTVQPDPIYPVEINRTTNRRLSKVPKRCCNNTKVARIKVPKSPVVSTSEFCTVPDENKHRQNFQSIKGKDSQKQRKHSHPVDCCCSSCESESKGSPSEISSYSFQTDKNFFTDNFECENRSTQKTTPKKRVTDKPEKESCLPMSNAAAEKCMKNYMYDNPDLKESKVKRGNVDIDNDFGSDAETWLVQCPKGFDPSSMLNLELGKIGKHTRMECTADRFSDKRTLVLIAPEKAAEYQLFCENMKLVQPVGKIVISEKFDKSEYSSPKNSVAESDCRSSQKKPAANRQSDEECTPSADSMDCDSNDVDSNEQSVQGESCDESEEEVRQPVGAKKLQKKVDEQKFTIETTVTVEKCGDRKKNKNARQCLPLVPTEPSPMKGKKKKTSKSDELNWMNC